MNAEMEMEMRERDEQEAARKAKEARKWRTVCVDFDGVLHSYTTKWINAHTIPDPPVPGAIEWLHQTIQHFPVVVFSTRAKTWRGRRAMRRWLKLYAHGLWYESMDCRGLEEMKISYKKVPAMLYIDDRAYRFDGGNWPSRDEIYAAKPWIKLR